MGDLLARTDAIHETALSAFTAREPALAFLGEMAKRFPQGEWFLVGGAVRDAILGREGRKDYDLVVRRIGLEDLSRALASYGAVDHVGRNFGVLKFVPKGFEDRPAIDIAWPRTERAGGSGGYRDFSVASDPDLPIEDDLRRRDFTMNAIAWDLLQRRIVDPFGGRADIASRTIRAVGAPEERFREDYTRMLRAVRFVCELGFAIERGTADALKRCAPHINDARADAGSADGSAARVVPYESVAKELVRAMAADPYRCIALAEDAGLLYRLFPELEALRGCPQPENFHSEGDVWTHTKLALAALRSEGFSALFPGETASAETAFAVLFHDVAKPMTREVHPDGSMTFYGHPDHGAAIARNAAERLRLASAHGSDIDPDRLGWLVKMHLFPSMVDVAEVRRTTLERHFLSDPRRGRSLLHLAYADASATIPKDAEPDLSALRRTMRAVDALSRGDGARVAPPRLLTGEDVMRELGIGPGPDVGAFLEELREAQLTGKVSDIEGAKAMVRKLHSA